MRSREEINEYIRAIEEENQDLIGFELAQTALKCNRRAINVLKWVLDG